MSWLSVTAITCSPALRLGMLPQCLVSVHEQTIGSVPHLLAVDGYESMFPLIVNQLAEAAGSEWLLFLDPEQRIVPTFLEGLSPSLYDCDVVLQSRIFGAPVQSSGRILMIRTELFLESGGFDLEPKAAPESGLLTVLSTMGARMISVPSNTLMAPLP